MTDPNQDSTISLTLPVMASPPLSTRPSEIEEEVIFLFDQLYDRLSGYLLSFGLTVHDAEDIVQETFLSSGICSLAARGGIWVAGFSALGTTIP